MKKIDDYINNIYKDFDENDKETKILIEETKAHLYDEVEDLKKQGFNEEESIKQAIFNFGKEKSVAKELKDTLYRKDKFSKIFLWIALIVFCIGILFKLILIGYRFSGDLDRRWQECNKDEHYSRYIIKSIHEKLKDKDYIDNSTENEVIQMLDEFNERTDNGVYKLEIARYEGDKKTGVDKGQVVYEYNKQVSYDKTINAGSGESFGKGGWVIAYSITNSQCYYDNLVEDKAEVIISKLFILDELGNYLTLSAFVICWLLFMYKIYIRKKVNRNNIVFFSFVLISIMYIVLKEMTTFDNYFKNRAVLLITILLIISIIYNKKYIEN